MAMLRIALIALTALGSGLILPVHGQSWPAKAVKVIAGQEMVRWAKVIKDNNIKSGE